MFKEIYKGIFDQISPSEHLISATVASKRITREVTKNYSSTFRKPVLASIAVVLCLLLSVPALAANVLAVYELLYSISPSTAQFFKPIQKSYENNGIKMEVVSAYIHDDTAEIYITLQDLTGSRIDDTTDLLDSYSIHRPFESSASCQRVDFDETTNTATFFISITEWGNKNITGDKITFSVREFISGKQTYDGVRVDLDLSNIPENPSTMPLPTEYGGGFGGNYALIKDNPIVLTPSTSINLGINEIVITGVGYIDGMLHIQTFPGNISTNDNHGYVYVKDNNGNDIKSVYSMAFNDYQNGEQVRYNEDVFDIPQSELGNYELYGYFVISGIYTDGYWQVTFPLE